MRRRGLCRTNPTKASKAGASPNQPHQGAGGGSPPKQPHQGVEARGFAELTRGDRRRRGWAGLAAILDKLFFLFLLCFLPLVIFNIV